MQRPPGRGGSRPDPRDRDRDGRRDTRGVGGADRRGSVDDRRGAGDRRRLDDRGDRDRRLDDRGDRDRRLDERSRRPDDRDRRRDDRDRRRDDRDGRPDDRDRRPDDRDRRPDNRDRDRDRRRPDDGDGDRDRRSDDRDRDRDRPRDDTARRPSNSRDAGGGPDRAAGGRREPGSDSTDDAGSGAGAGAGTGTVAGAGAGAGAIDTSADAPSGRRATVRFTNPDGPSSGVEESKADAHAQRPLAAPVMETRPSATKVGCCSPLSTCSGHVGNAVARAMLALRSCFTGRGLRQLQEYNSQKHAAAAYTQLVNACRRRPLSLAVRIGKLSASVPDHYALRPVVRVTVLDVCSGRLVRKSTVTKPAVTYGEAAGVVTLKARQNSSKLECWDAPVAYLEPAACDVVPPAITGPSQRSIRSKTAVLARHTGRQNKQRRNNLASLPPGTIPCWEQTLVFDVDVASVLSPNSAVFFEVLVRSLLHGCACCRF